MQFTQFCSQMKIGLSDNLMLSLMIGHIHRLQHFHLFFMHITYQCNRQLIPSNLENDNKVQQLVYLPISRIREIILVDLLIELVEIGLVAFVEFPLEWGVLEVLLDLWEEDGVGFGDEFYAALQWFGEVIEELVVNFAQIRGDVMFYILQVAAHPDYGICEVINRLHQIHSISLAYPNALIIAAIPNPQIRQPHPSLLSPQRIDLFLFHYYLHHFQQLAKVGDGLQFEVVLQEVEGGGSGGVDLVVRGDEGEFVADVVGEEGAVELIVEEFGGGVVAEGSGELAQAGDQDVGILLKSIRVHGSPFLIFPSKTARKELALANFLL